MASAVAKGNTTLMALGLGDNHIGVKGAGAFTAALRHRTIFDRCLNIMHPIVCQKAIRAATTVGRYCGPICPRRVRPVVQYYSKLMMMISVTNYRLPLLPTATLPSRQMTCAAVLGGWSAFGYTGFFFNSIVSVYRRCRCGGRGGGHRHQRGVVASEKQLVMTLKRKQSDTTIVAIGATMRDVDGVDEENNGLINTHSSSPSNYANNNDKASDPGTPSKSITKSAHFIRDMSIVGILRGLTVVLGLVALEHVPVSFVETIKATAPAFTVVFARLILQERTAPPVVMSLIPVIVGLVLCSASELRFDAVGFIAAVMNNCADCVQNVLSKRMLTHMSPIMLQFYASAAALTLQAPLLVRDVAGLALGLWSSHHHGGSTKVEESSSSDLLEDLDIAPLRHLHLSEDDQFANLATTASWHRELSLSHLLLLDAVFYHLQSVSAYSVMGCMSPVSQSVANTLKRALLVWASILYFGNPVTNSGIAGMGMVVLGVFLYNHTRQNHH